MAPFAAGICEDSFPWLFLMSLATLVQWGQTAGGQERERGEPSTALASEGIRWNLCLELANLSELSRFLLKRPEFSELLGLGSVNSSRNKGSVFCEEGARLEEFESRSSGGPNSPSWKGESISGLCQLSAETDCWINLIILFVTHLYLCHCCKDGICYFTGQA